MAILAARLEPWSTDVRVVQPKGPDDQLRASMFRGASGPRMSGWIKERLATYRAPVQTLRTVQPKVAEAATQNGAHAIVEPKSRKPDKPHKTRPPKWTELGLILSDHGIPVPTLDNAMRVIEHDSNIAGHIWFDVFLQRILHNWDQEIVREWTDADDLRLQLYLQRDVGIGKITKGTASDAATAYAKRENRNCAYDWLDSLQWDGFPYLENLAVQGFGADNTEYNSAVCRNLILSMVKRVFVPGCKCDYMPVFEGDQGIGKSVALGILGGEWFAELHISWENKDFFDALKGKMLLEIGEMHAFRQSDVDRIKGIVSCASDRYRASYGRHTEDYPRQCVFVGTTNRRDWNRDDTGARRFWPIVCGKIDHTWLRENRDQLFAEAVHQIRASATYWEVPWDEAGRQQDARRAPDSWEDVLTEYVIGKSRLLMSDILREGLGIDVGKQTLSDQQRAGRVLKQMGWHNPLGDRDPSGKRKRTWQRISAGDEPAPGELFEE
jgi:predicted P-loop ATPase